MAHAASKTLSQLSAATKPQRPWVPGKKNKSGTAARVPPAAECLLAVRQAQTSARRDFAVFEDVMAVRSFGAEEAMKDSEKRGFHISSAMLSTRNVQAEEESNLRSAVDPPSLLRRRNHRRRDGRCPAQAPKMSRKLLMWMREHRTGPHASAL
ncbi:uncharacterized protein LOC142355233 [Convolutriloba macropyga]|uniref:uncharacterized protein LOC142355233 n=1 Tax=Convolutriloba macropyga TaxID=536237 RepID=UPI003F51F22D